VPVGAASKNGAVPATDLPDDPLAGFSVATRAWFEGSFAAPTAAQTGAWQAISRGDNALVVAPTGSGKTLAAFLWSIDRLASTPRPEEAQRRCRVLYISPMKALAVDVERNLRAPLTGIRHAAARLGLPEPDLTVATRSGDTPADERRRFGRTPPDILITTPESLFLLLTSQARESLRGVETVIVDEVHAVAATKRGAHLTLSLERLDALLDRPAQRVGLSATVRPVDEVAQFLGGSREVTVVQPPSSKTIELEVVVPVEDMSELGESTGEVSGSASGAEVRSSIWPHVEERIVDLVQAHRSTIVFANSRRLAERLCARLNEIVWEREEGQQLPSAGGLQPAAVMAQSGASRGVRSEIARAHHGSVSKEQRAEIEEALKAGRLPAVVATSSLELGIDMGAVDLVIQVESPPSVASGLQRVGRAGHHVGAVSRGVIFPKYRGDLVQTAVVAERMRDGAIEAIHYPRNPLDVLAQQIVAMVAVDEWQVDELYDVVRRAANYGGLPRSAFESVLDMLSGRYPSDEFAELRPRLVWDRVAGTLTGRPGAQRLAVTSGGTIPDRGLFGVFLVGEKQSRVGELDEEMVYESRVGDVFTLGSTAWRIEEITHDRVLVTPAPGQPGRLPFWKGDALGRPAELGRALGAFVRELGGLTPAKARERVLASGLDAWAADNLLAYLAEQREATGHLPDDRTIVVERFRDELGDWRVAIHSPFGAQVHAPWALAVAARLRERYGVDVQAMHADDGIVLRLPDTEFVDDTVPPQADVAVFGSDEIEGMVTAEVGGSAMFAARFRECAARALLLPRRNPGRRTPLWQQRQRSAQLLSVASDYGSFPVVLETMRECLQDVFDVPGLVRLMRDVEERRVQFVEVETQQPSPFARSLLFGYIAQFLYEGDSPLAERRAAALALDSTLLAELLGQQGYGALRELLDPETVLALERDLQRLSDERRARDLEGVADLLRVLGPLSTAEAVERGATPAWLAGLEESRRAIRVRVAGEERWAAVEDAGRLRDALGTPLPVGVPDAFLEPLRDPLGDVVARYARTHVPFTVASLASRLGLGAAVVGHALARLAGNGRVVEGEFLPGGAGTEWCDAEVLRTLRRRSLAALRKEVEPVPPAALGQFLPTWQHVGGRLRGVDGVLRVVEQLQGAAVPASALESLVLPARVTDYTPAMLDELCAAGEVLWVGHGALPGSDGWLSLHLADTASLTLPDHDPTAVSTPLHESLVAALAGGGAFFFRQLSDAAGASDDRETLAALWDLAWGGYVAGDTLAPVRALVGGGRGSHRPRAAVPRGRYGRGRPAMPVRSGPPSAVGRWSALPARETDPTRRAHTLAETLLDRHGVVIRGAVMSEHAPGGFAAVYRVLAAFEETGRCRRGYFVEGLGAAQFAVPGAVDRLRAMAVAAERDLSPYDRPFHETSYHAGGAGGGVAATSRALVLAATDPANPFGAALPWPARRTDLEGKAPGHRPGRKAGALVVLVDGELAVYVERGGRTLLTWTEHADPLQLAVDALALAVRDGHLGRLTVERADGVGVLARDSASPLGAALESAGFHATPRGLRLRR
jgi:ATP-dependent helicase Lhr and Lhr-like helicase